MADNDIAIVGLAAHLPGAADPTAYWRNLVDGVESIRELSEQELIDAGVGEAELRKPNYVRSAAPLDGVFDFDADFFGLSPKEAGIMDPQHRHFLMAAWEAMEDAGHVPSSFDGAIGVFAGCGMGSYFMRNLLTNPDLVRDVGVFLLRHTGNDKDFLATRASYSLNLRGPSVNVQTACSTSLVATHLAVQHLLSGECDLALAGGSTIEIPHGQGYVYHEGEVLSPDGHCRAFDHRSQGTVFGSGAGVVALRRLDDALDDGDRIYAVIKGTAVNNDGDQKVGYLAPSVDGQAACVSEAIAVSDVDPGSIQYVECHGTGTPMGDPIEVAALTQAFDLPADVADSCRIGSVKTNIGHLDTAAGVAGLIKVALSLHHGAIPASLNFEQPNPNLELDDSPFVVNDHLTPWTAGVDGPRRAGVNSLGVGGTNAFVVLEEAPIDEPASVQVSAKEGEEQSWHLLTLSARNRSALDDACVRLADHLADNLDMSIGDVARTLFVGRHHFDERRVVAVRDVAEAITLLRSDDQRRLPTHTATPAELGLTFMFPGGGSQHLGMGADLYRSEPVFAAQVDRGLELLRERHDLDLGDLLLGEDRSPELDRRLASMAHQLPLIFVVEYALAELLMSWGLEPSALIGHSLGENTAACVSGTISFEDCLGLVVLRGRLMDTVEGAAVAVPLTPEDVADAVARLDLDLAVVNAPDVVVVSGSRASLDLFEQEVRASGVEPLPVQVTTPVHSRLLDPVLGEFGDYLRSIELKAPSIPWVSNTTGTWITAEQATDPEYWVRHLRSTVMFADDVATLAADGPRILLEVGPGKTLSSLVRAHPATLKSHQVPIPAMRHPEESTDDNAALLTAVGRTWAAGATIDTDRWFPADGRRAVGLPTYPFQTQTFFIAPGGGMTESDDLAFVDREPDVDRWSWKPVWKSKDREEAVEGPVRWLVFADSAGFADEVVQQLRSAGDGVVVVRMGDLFRAVSDEEYILSPELGLAGYESLVKDLVRADRLPDRVAHMSLLATDDRDFRPGSSFFHRNQELGFQSLVYLAQAWSGAGVQRSVSISVATMGSQLAPGDRSVPVPEQATVLGPVQVIPRELADVAVSTFDLDPAQVAVAVGAGVGTSRSFLERLRSTATSGEDQRVPLVDEVVAELRAPIEDASVALRGDRRFVRDVRRSSLPAPDQAVLRRNGVVLITGGLGGIGLSVAEALHRERGARLALLARRGLPPRDTWDEVLERLGEDHPTAERIRGVLRLEEQGARVLVVEGDVTDPESLGLALSHVRAEYGALNGIVHAAGVIDDAPMVTKSPMQMEDVLAPKVYGTLVLESATASDELDVFVVFSSTSTVTAPIGQVDYVAANSFLNAFAESRRARGEENVRAVNWGVWDEVGMAAAAAGVPHPDVDEVEVRPAVHPFFGDLRRSADGMVRLSIEWNERDSWMLDEHRTGDGDAVVAGATYLELARAALAELKLDRPFEIRDLTFLRPLAVDENGAVSAEVLLDPTESGYRFRVRERVAVTSYGGEGEVTSVRHGWRLTGEADLLLHKLDAADRLDMDHLRVTCARRGATRSHQQDHLRFGPRWDVVDEVRYGDGVAVADLQLGEPFQDLDRAVGLHPALVDLGTGFAMDLIPGYTGDRLWVPVEYRRIRIHGRLPADPVAVVEVLPGTSEESGVATFDVKICDRDGRVLVDVEGFAVKRLDGRLDVGSRAVLASEVDFDEAVGSRQRSLPELAFENNLRQGIRPSEGGREFLRVIGPGVEPVVYVTSLDLPALRHQGDLIAAEQTGSGSGGDASAVFSRPKLDSEFVAARNDVEEQLVVMWQELLGIDQVGVHDNFFDLGGHSLIAVRLFAQIKRTFSVDFPISVLVEAPTVEACAGLISAAMPSEDDAEASGAPSLVAASPRYRYLVAMHPGDGTDRTPFFLVAGMFGNVLNLRHLAHQIGTDRPFYGIQARGLFGDDVPHEDFVEMASEYLEEVRSVQPDGPYLLGGFSGGGIAAYEMAQQLVAAGEETSLLVMLDTPLPHQPPLKLSDRVKIQLDHLREEGPSYAVSWARNRVAWEKELRRRAQGPAAGADTALHSEVIEAAFYRALGRYQVRPYGGTVSLYRPRLTPAHVFGPDRQIDINRRFVYFDNGWGPYCREVDVTEVPGDHDSMVLEPAVRVLAGHIRKAIDVAEGRGQDDASARRGMATAS